MRAEPQRKRRPALRLFLAALLASASIAVAAQHIGQQPAVMSEASARAVVEELAGALERYFLVPSVGKLYSAKLRARLASGSYGGLASDAFARALTADLQRVHADGHLRVRAPSTRSMLGSPSAAEAEAASEETGIERSGWLADGIAYIGFEIFLGSKASLAAVRKFLDEHKSARTLIIDARTHGGGYTDEFDLIASYVYDRPVELMYLDTREAAIRPKPDTPTLKRIEGPPGFVRQVNLAAPSGPATGLRATKIIVLTSGYTGSAAEHLALALKRTGRATIIGETTAGMGHFGKIVELHGGYSAFIPIGLPFDPDTGAGWEGVGVQPHLDTPARDALEMALVRLGLPPARARRLSVDWMPRGDMNRVIPLRTP